MTARDVRIIFAIVFIVSFGFFSNHLFQTGADKWAMLVTIVVVVAALFIAIDTIVATETSLAYRINRWWIEPKPYRVSAMIVAVGCLAVMAYLIGKLASL
jgi:hypothetical protein